MKKIIFTVAFVIAISFFGFNYLTTDAATPETQPTPSLILKKSLISFTETEMTVREEVASIRVKSYRNIETTYNDIPVVNGKAKIDNYRSEIMLLDNNGQPLTPWMSAN